MLQFSLFLSVWVFSPQADEKERYTLEEMLSDLADCQARQVNIIVDQSFSGEVARSIKRSHRHGNVVAYTSGKDHEYSWGSEFTKHWTSTNHTHRCAQHVFKVRSMLYYVACVCTHWYLSSTENTFIITRCPGTSTSSFTFK